MGTSSGAYELNHELRPKSEQIQPVYIKFHIKGLKVIFWFWRYLMRGGIWHLSQSSIRSSIYFNLIVKSRSNLFLEPTSTKK